MMKFAQKKFIVTKADLETVVTIRYIASIAEKSPYITHYNFYKIGEI